MLEKLFRWIETAFRLIDFLIMGAAAVGGFFATREFLALMEYSPFIQYAGAVAGALVAAIIAWLVWWVVKLLN